MCILNAFSYPGIDFTLNPCDSAAPDRDRTWELASRQIPINSSCAQPDAQPHFAEANEPLFCKPLILRSIIHFKPLLNVPRKDLACPESSRLAPGEQMRSQE